jgi:hypothetical protein
MVSIIALVVFRDPVGRDCNRLRDCGAIWPELGRFWWRSVRIGAELAGYDDIINPWMACAISVFHSDRAWHDIHWQIAEVSR